MDAKGKLLWLFGCLSATAIICCIALGLSLRSQGQLINRIQADVQIILDVRKADELAQSLRDNLYREAHYNAQAKYDALENIPDGLLDADWLDALRRGLRLTGGDGGADTTGKPDAANATPGATGGADAH